MFRMMYFNYTSIKLEKMNQKKKIKEQQKRHMFGRIHTKLLTGHGKQGRIYHLLLQLPSLNYLQAYITFKLKRKHNTSFCPPASAQPSGALSHASKQTRLLCQTKTPPGFEPRISGANSHPETMITVLLQNRDFIYTLCLHSRLGPTVREGMIAQEDNGLINLYPRLDSPCQLPIWVIKPAGSPISAFRVSAGPRDRAPLEGTLSFSRGAISWVTLGQAS